VKREPRVDYTCDAALLRSGRHCNEGLQVQTLSSRASTPSFNAEYLISRLVMIAVMFLVHVGAEVRRVPRFRILRPTRLACKLDLARNRSWMILVAAVYRHPRNIARYTYGYTSPPLPPLPRAPRLANSQQPTANSQQPTANSQRYPPPRPAELPSTSYGGGRPFPAGAYAAGGYSSGSTLGSFAATP